MTVSKIKLPDNTEHDIRAKYLIQSTSSDATSAEFSARTVTEDAIANIQKIYGNTIKWNQLCKYTDLSTTVNDVIITVSNSKITLFGTASSAITRSNYISDPTVRMVNGHKYFCKNTTGFPFYATSPSTGVYQGFAAGTNIVTFSKASFPDGKVGGPVVSSGSVCNTSGYFSIIDLTDIYGAGNEPTAEEFEAQLPAAYYIYDPGSLPSNSATAILSREFNQWDEQWEVGSITPSTGQKEPSSLVIRSKNYIKVSPSTSYYFYCKGNAQNLVYFYDPYYTFISGVGAANNGSFTTPSNAAFVLFRMASTYGTSYNNDICINISDTAMNGTYEPYNGHQIDLNIPTLTGKLNGTGSSVVIFPDGLKKAGTVYDELVGNKVIKRVYAVDVSEVTVNSVSTGLFQLTINSSGVRPGRAFGNGNFNIISNKYPTYTAAHSKNSTIAQLAAAHDKTLFVNAGSTVCYIQDSAYTSTTDFLNSGVEIFYEMDTSQEYILDNALQLQYPVVAGGTEMILPTTGTAPMKMDVIYGNAADAAATMSQNFISVDSMKEFLDKLGTQMGGTWNMGYENGKHTFTFTSN